MTQTRVGIIEIRPSVIVFGPAIYPLRQVSRVRTQNVVWSRPLQLNLTSVLLVALLATLVLLAARIDASTAAASGVGFGIALLLFDRLFRVERYALIVETAGGQVALLTSREKKEVDAIAKDVLEAIENPPDQLLPIAISGDVVMRDKFVQGGSGNFINTGG